MELSTERDSGLQLGLELTKEFISKLIDVSGKCIKRIQILPDQIVNETPELQAVLENTDGKIICYNDTVAGIQEIIVSKSAFQRIFLESYQHIYKNNPDTLESKDLLVATLGILFATPIDTTAMRLSWSILNGNLNIENSFTTYFLLAGYLTSNYDKTNKSSCLWVYFKKLHVKIIVSGYVKLKTQTTTCINLDAMDVEKWMDSGSDYLLLVFAIRTCLRSIMIHPRNYYASNALRFFIANTHDLSIFNVILDFLERECDDLSLWNLLCDSIIDVKTGQLNWYRDEWNRYTGTISKLKEFKLELFVEIYQRIKYLGFNVCSYGAMLASYRLHKFLSVDDNWENEINEKVDNFEQIYGEIDYKKKCLQGQDPLDNKTAFTDNLLLRDEFNNACNIKKVIKLSEKRSI
jgi:hypothetical protein